MCKGAGSVAQKHSGPTALAAVEELTYAVEEWSEDGNRLIEALSRASSQGIAVSAFKAVRASTPTRRIRLRQRARIILDSTEAPKR